MKNPGFPKGWDEKRVSGLLAHYETQSGEESSLKTKPSRSIPSRP